MNQNTFEKLFDEQVQLSREVLVEKAKQYAEGTEDRLHNFKQAANLMRVTSKQACGAFMAKHVISIFDMIHNDKEYPQELWDEKITDNINYLFLLKGLVKDDNVLSLSDEEMEYVNEDIKNTKQLINSIYGQYGAQITNDITDKNEIRIDLTSSDGIPVTDNSVPNILLENPFAGYSALEKLDYSRHFKIFMRWCYKIQHADDYEVTPSGYKIKIPWDSISLTNVDNDDFTFLLSPNNVDIDTMYDILTRDGFEVEEILTLVPHKPDIKRIKCTIKYDSPLLLTHWFCHDVESIPLIYRLVARQAVVWFEKFVEKITPICDNTEEEND